jgi:hypothetical protein
MNILIVIEVWYVANLVACLINGMWPTLLPALLIYYKNFVVSNKNLMV